MDSKQKQLHIAIFPWLAYGHMMPFLEVSKFLAQKGHRVSYISTPKNIARLPKLPHNLSSSSLVFVKFSLPHVHGLPPGAESTADVPIDKVPCLKRAYDKLQASLTEFLQNSNVNWIIHDFAPYWLPGIVAPLGVNMVYLSTFTATTLAFLGPPSALLSDQRKKLEDFTIVPEWIDYPSNVAYKLHEIVNHQQCMEDDVSDFQRGGLLIQGCQFVAVRTCFEFEPEEIKVLIKLYQKPVVPVGLLPPSLPSNEYYDKWEAIQTWLDNKSERSVLYIALGSEVNPSEETMRELASGIDKSNMPFIWVVKNRPMVDGKAMNIIPPGFEERVSNKSLVLRDWVPQLRILAHSSVGGMLSHGGWSSVIEALKFGRPLILLSGGHADQGLNCRMLNGKKVGLEVERNEADGSFASDLVAETIRLVMVEPKGDVFRANAWAMKELFGNQKLSDNHLDGFTRFIQDFSPSACSTSV